MRSIFCFLLVPVPPSTKQTLFLIFNVSWIMMWCLDSVSADVVRQKIVQLVLTLTLSFQSTSTPIAGKIVRIFPCLSLNTVCTCYIVVIVFLNWFWPLFSPHRVSLVTTAGSLQCLHQIKSNRQNVSLKPISSFCSWKHMFETSEEFSAYNRSGHSPAHVEFSTLWKSKICADKFWNCGF